MAGDGACPGRGTHSPDIFIQTRRRDPGTGVLPSAPARARLLGESTRVTRLARAGVSPGRQGAREPSGRALQFRGFILLSLSFLNHGKIHTTLNVPSEPFLSTITWSCNHHRHPSPELPSSRKIETLNTRSPLSGPWRSPFVLLSVSMNWTTRGPSDEWTPQDCPSVTGSSH